LTEKAGVFTTGNPRTVMLKELRDGKKNGFKAQGVIKTQNRKVKQKRSNNIQS